MSEIYSRNIIYNWRNIFVCDINMQPEYVSFLSQVAGCLDNDGRTIQALDTADDGHLLAMGSTGNHVRLASIL